MTKLEVIQSQYGKALKRFEEVLKEEKSDIIRDASIIRFEFTFDLSWKFLKAYLEEKKGVRVSSPKESFREAYRQGIIEYETYWLDMTDWRNEAVHTYGDKFAEDLYEKFPEVLRHFKKLEKILEK